MEKIKHRKRRFRELATCETTDVVDTNDTRKQKKLKRKSKSMDNSSSSGSREHSSKYRRTSTDIFGSNDVRIEQTQTSTNNIDTQNESACGSFAVQTITSELEEKRFETGAGKRKRKHRVVVVPPLVVEAETPTESNVPTLLFQKVENDEPENSDRALKQVYKSLMKMSADVYKLNEKFNKPLEVHRVNQSLNESKASPDLFHQCTNTDKIHTLKQSFNKHEISAVSFHQPTNANKIHSLNQSFNKHEVSPVSFHQPTNANKIHSLNQSFNKHEMSAVSFHQPTDANKIQSLNQSFNKHEISPVSFHQPTDANKVHRLNQSFNKHEVSPILFHQLTNTNKFLVFMKHPFRLFFRGVVNLTVLRGVHEVLGCILNPKSTPRQTIYSPRGSCMLEIQACYADPANSEDYEVLKKAFKNLGLDMISKDVITNIEDRGCVVLLEQATPPLELYLENVLPDQQVFSYPALKRGMGGREFEKEPNLQTAEAVLNCMFNFANHQKFHQFTKSAEWEDVSHMIIRSNKEEAGACTVVCGGKNVGKSTYLRFLVNCHLAMCEEVLYLDFDPGQAEFTVPGCVSAVVVKKPLLGPNFTHITTPECMVYVGDVNLANCPWQYIDSVEYVLKYCRGRTDFQKIPWVVNTMGFNVGIGVDFAVNVLRLVKPRFVVQIESRDPKKNYPQHLSPQYVQGYRHKFPSVHFTVLEYSLVIMKTKAEFCRQVLAKFSLTSLPSYVLRDLMILAYVSQFFHKGAYSLTDVKPYKIRFSKIILGVLHKSMSHTVILSAMNRKLVGLCVYEGKDVLIPEDDPYPRILRNPAVCRCLGFGVVRDIYFEKKKLELVTCLSEEQLSQVNCLMLGAVTLPPYVYPEIGVGNGDVPNIITGPGQKTSKTYR